MLDGIAAAARRTRTPEDARELAEWAKNELILDMPEAALTGRNVRAGPAGAVECLRRSLSLRNAPDGAQPAPESTRFGVEKPSVAMDSSPLRHRPLRLCGQEDPKTVYKQEGMKEFKVMWEGIEDKVTDTVFRMEETEAFQESVWTISASHPRIGPACDCHRAQQACRPTAQRRARSPSRSATAAKKSAATIRVRAAAARSIRTATCARRRCSFIAACGLAH